MPTARIFATFFCVGVMACAQGPATAAAPTDWPALDAASTAFVGVSVVSMGDAGTLRDRTVIIRDGRIAEIGPAASTRVPLGARRIEGRGRFLAPGLIDMHAHFDPGDGAISDPLGRQLNLSLANGLTTVRGLIARPGILDKRERARKGELLAPAMVVAGPSVNGNSAPTPEAARAIVAKSAADGYDLIKTHAGMTREAYDAMAAEAARQRFTLVGHVTPGFGLWRAIEVGQNNEHMDGFMDAALPQGAAPTKGQFDTDMAMLSKVEPAKFAAVARALKQRDLCVGPTLSLYRQILGPEPVELYAARPELRYAAPKAVEDWKAKKAEWLAGRTPGSDKFLELRSQALKALKAEGVVLSAGGDSPHPFLVPGFSLRREMEAMVAEGLTPADAFRAATRDAAYCLRGYGTDIGQVAVGKRADLILLDGDPTVALKPLERPAGVMVRGRWLDRAELDRMLQAVADSAAKG